MSGSRAAAFLFALVALTASAAFAALGAGERIDLSVRGAPLGTALKQLYAGTPVRVEVAPALAAAPVTADLRGVTRAAALRILLRVSGQSGIVRQVADLLTISQLPGGGASASATRATDSASFSFTNGSITGFSVGPGGQQVPNQSFSSIQSTLHVPDGQTTYVGGTSTGNASTTRTQFPFLPGGTRLRTRTTGSVGTFITVTVIPDPVPDHHRP